MSVRSRCAPLADITCDSDGKIDRFIDIEETRKTIPLHTLKKGEDYYIGLFLTGAYQDVMGDMHNLFGRLNEVHVFSDENDPSDFYIEEHIRGNSSQQVLATMQYNPEYMAHVIKKSIDKQVQRGKITPREGVKLVDFYEECLNSYTYLK
jgi:arginine decarboxylase